MKFRVGNRVEHDFYGMGTVIGVSDMDTPLVEFDNPGLSLHDGNGVEKNGTRGKHGHCYYTSNIKPLSSQTVVIYPKGLETIALLKEGKKVIKQANAKCNPTDEFDFNVGAKLAFSRLMGEEKTEDKGFDWQAFKQGKFAVHCDTEEKAKAFLKECDEQGIKWAGGDKTTSKTLFPCDRTYGILYFCNGSYIRYSINPELYEDENIVECPSSNTIREVRKLADYTNKEIFDELAKRLEDKK